MGEFINSHQARFDKSHVSCGVTEVHHLPNDTPGNTVFAIATNLFHKTNGRASAFVIFSDVVDKEEKSRGERLAEEIKRMNMGPLVESNKRVNPRSGNTIKLWTWEFDPDKLRSWYVEEHANRVSD